MRCRWLSGFGFPSVVVVVTALLAVDCKGNRSRPVASSADAVASPAAMQVAAQDEDAGSAMLPPPSAQVVLPSDPNAERKNISVARLIGLLKARKDLQRVTPEMAAIKFAPLVSNLAETNKDDTGWEFEGTNSGGLVGAVTVRFVPTVADGWAFGSVSVHLQPDDQKATFDEIRRVAKATLKKPRWIDLNAGDRLAWSLGEGWELVAAGHESGEIELRVGRPGGP